MRLFALTIGVMLFSSLAQAKELIVNSGGKDVAITYRTLNREIGEKDRGAGSQNSALECSFLYHGLLAQGDLQGASKLTTDPAAAVGQWANYQERLGADDFKKEMADYFTSKNTVLAELFLGEDAMLVVKTPEYIAGQLYQKRNGKYIVFSGRPSSDSFKALGKALTQIQEGKIKL